MSKTNTKNNRPIPLLKATQNGVNRAQNHRTIVAHTTDYCISIFKVESGLDLRASVCRNRATTYMLAYFLGRA